jgi:hypothetical protein
MHAAGCAAAGCWQVITKLAAIPKTTRTSLNLIRIRDISMDSGCPEAGAKTTLALVVVVSAPLVLGNTLRISQISTLHSRPNFVDNRRYKTPTTLP